MRPINCPMSWARSRWSATLRTASAGECTRLPNLCCICITSLYNLLASPITCLTCFWNSFSSTAAIVGLAKSSDARAASNASACNCFSEKPISASTSSGVLPMLPIAAAAPARRAHLESDPGSAAEADALLEHAWPAEAASGSGTDLGDMAAAELEEPTDFCSLARPARTSCFTAGVADRADFRDVVALLDRTERMPAMSGNSSATLSWSLKSASPSLSPGNLGSSSGRARSMCKVSALLTKFVAK